PGRRGRIGWPPRPTACRAPVTSSCGAGARLDTCPQHNMWQQDAGCVSRDVPPAWAWHAACSPSGGGRMSGPRTRARRRPLDSRFHAWLVAAVIGLALIASPRGASAHPDGSYPLTFNLDWGNNPDALRNSKYDVVSLSSRAQPARWDSIKALNP